MDCRSSMVSVVLQRAEVFRDAGLRAPARLGELSMPKNATSC